MWQTKLFVLALLWFGSSCPQGSRRQLWLLSSWAPANFAVCKVFSFFFRWQFFAPFLCRALPSCVKLFTLTRLYCISNTLPFSQHQQQLQQQRQRQHVNNVSSPTRCQHTVQAAMKMCCPAQSPLPPSHSPLPRPALHTNCRQLKILHFMTLRNLWLRLQLPLLLLLPLLAQLFSSGDLSKL